MNWFVLVAAILQFGGALYAGYQGQWTSAGAWFFLATANCFFARMA